MKANRHTDKKQKEQRKQRGKQEEITKKQRLYKT